MAHAIHRWLRQLVPVGLVMAACLFALALSNAESGLLAQRNEEPPWVEFDLPADFWAELTDGSHFVTGIGLGYFRTNGDLPLRTIDFERASVTVSGNAGRLPLDADWLADLRERVVIRLRTLTRDDMSDWSEPSESISIILQVNPIMERSLSVRAER